MSHAGNAGQARVVFSTGSLHVIDTAYCFELAAEAGYDGIEILCDDRWSTRDPDYLKKLSERFHIPILVVHSAFGFKLMGWRNGTDELQRILHSLRLAETLNAEALVVHLPRPIGALWIDAPGKRLLIPWFSPFVGVKKWFGAELAQTQAQTRVKIAVENLPTISAGGRKFNPAWWNTVAEWSQVHQWLTMDTTHWATHRIDPLDAYSAAGSRVCHVHLSNYDGREHRLPHKGQMDLGKLLRKMAADGFSGTICTELYPDSLEFHDTAGLRQNLRDSVAFCREHLGQPLKQNPEPMASSTIPS